MEPGITPFWTMSAFGGRGTPCACICLATLEAIWVLWSGRQTLMLLAEDGLSSLGFSRWGLLRLPISDPQIQVHNGRANCVELTPHRPEGSRPSIYGPRRRGQESGRLLNVTDCVCRFLNGRSVHARIRVPLPRDEFVLVN